MTGMRRFALAGVITLAGCIAIPQAPVTQSTRQVATNYTVGKRDSIVVGSPVVAVKDYMVRRTTYPGVEPSSPVEVKASRLSCRFGADSVLAFGPTRKTGGQEFRTVAMPCGWVIAFLAIDSLGQPTGEWASEGRGWSPEGLTLSPANVRFEPAVREVVDPTGGFTNYELLYGGTDGRAFTLTYREYTPDNLIRPAFSQTLTFQNDAGTIRFRNLQFQIHSVTSERLVFTVVSDQA